MITGTWLLRHFYGGRLATHHLMITCMGLLVGSVLAQVAPSVVPKNWNVSPLVAGAYLEGFEGEQAPEWLVDSGSSTLITEFPLLGLTNLPVRLNTWFESGSKVVNLDTEGESVSNTLRYDDETSVDFSSKAVYVDMRLRFEPVSNEPDFDNLADIKLVVYVSVEGKLTAVHLDEENQMVKSVYDPVVPLEVDNWYQVTVVLENGRADVLLNDVKVLENLKLNETENIGKLEAVSFRGTGLLDNFYVSHGDPAYGVLGPTVAVPTLPDATGLDDVAVTGLHRFMQDQGVTGEVALKSGTTQGELNAAYMLNALKVAEGVAELPAFEFGIAALDVVAPDKLQVVAKLSVDQQPKQGTINGKIQLLGKISEADESWTTLSGAITPNFADFTDGTATYDFDLPSGGYVIFKTQIVP